MRRRRQEGPRAEGWWQDGDGRWYPPSGARHPAGLGDAHAARAAAKQDAAHRRRVWMFWGALLIPLLMLAGVFLSMVDFATGPHPDRTDAATGGRSRASSTAGTTGEETTTVPGVDTEAPTEPSVAAAEGQSSGNPGATTTARSSGSAAAGGSGGEQPAGSSQDSGRSHDGDADQDDDEDDDQDDDVEAPPPGTGTTSPSTTSTTAPPTVRVPDDAEDCKHGGWADYTDDRGNPFPNQGQCIAFVQGSSG